MIINAKIDQYKETEGVVGAISREFQRSPRQFYNAKNLPTRSPRMVTSLFRIAVRPLDFITFSLAGNLFHNKMYIDECGLLQGSKEVTLHGM